MKPVVKLYKLGRLPYVEAFNIQQALFEKLKSDVTNNNCSQQQQQQTTSNQLNHITNSARINLNTTTENVCPNFNNYARNSLILVEHEPVYTIGIRSKQYNDNYVKELKKELEVRKLEAEFVKTNRGGLITFHGPGQLVAYPIIYLGDFTNTIQNRSVKAYVNLLEATIIDTLKRVGLDDAHTVQEYPGVWLDGGERKIAFIGISCKRFVTMHGISINCDCDLSWFDYIVSCGIEDKQITSVKQELALLPMKATKASSQSVLINNNYEYRHAHADDDDEGQRNYPTNNINDPNYHHCQKKVSCFGSISDHQSTTTTSKGGSKFKNYVEQISKAFCLSFSQHFDCILKEGDANTLSIFGKKLL